MALLESELIDPVTVSDDKNEVDDEVGAWPSATVVSLEEVDGEIGVTELTLSEFAVGGPLASELPMEDKACVLGVTELRLVLGALTAVLVMSATPTELAAGEDEIGEDATLSAAEVVLEDRCGGSAP